MKTKILLTLCAILVTVVAISCSNGSRSTSPLNATESLNLPNGTDNNRFENVVAASTKLGPEGGYYILRGTFLSDPSGCQSLQLDKSNYIELDFIVPPPQNLTSGMIVQVRGLNSTEPGGHCQLSRSFQVFETTILGERTHRVKDNTFLGE